MTAKETYLISAPESDEFDPLDKAYRREQLQWLADRGLCSWSETVEYFAGQQPERQTAPGGATVRA